MKSTTCFVHSSCRHWLSSEGTGVKVLGNPTLEKAVVLALPVALLLGFWYFWRKEVNYGRG